MAQECISLAAIQNFASKDVNRIIGQIGRVLARKSPYINSIDGGTLPNVSDVVRSVVEEMAVPAASLAAPTFVNDTTLCGVGATPDVVGSTEYQFQLQTLRGAANGDFYLDVKNPKLYKKVRRFYENDGVVFSGEPLDDYEMLMEYIAQDLESVEVA